MNFLIVSVAICLCASRSTCLPSQAKTQTQQTKHTDALPTSQKVDTYAAYGRQQLQQQQLHQNPPSYVQKPTYVMQQPPAPALIVIAQPAYVPQSLLYGMPHQQATIQHLLAYLQGAAQSRYHQIPAYGVGGLSERSFQPQIYVQPHQYRSYPTTASGANTFQMLASPSIPVVSNYIQPYAATQILHPMHLANIAAQITSQHQTSHIASIPPIVTGLENFTPEQQAQIKTHLKAHLAGPSVAQDSGLGSEQHVVLTTQSTADKDKEAIDKHQYPAYDNPSTIYRTQFTKG